MALCEDLELAWSTESQPAYLRMVGGNSFWYLKKYKTGKWGSKKNLTLGKMKADSNTWPTVTNNLLQSPNSSK